MGTLLKSDDAIVSSHLEWCRQRILSVKPEEPLTAGMPLQEVSAAAYIMLCIAVLRRSICDDVLSRAITNSHAVLLG